jgi:hypothetical protein
LNKYVREIAEALGTAPVMVIPPATFFNNTVDPSLGFRLVNGDALSAASISDCDPYAAAFANAFSTLFS